MVVRDHVRSWVVPRFDYRDPSLVLYLPLWYQYSDMTAGNAGTIYSYDRTRTAVTVTGAVWSSQGRVFDGNDDSIKHTVANWRSGDSLGSVSVWFKYNTAGTRALFSSADEASTNRFLLCYLNGGDPYFYQVSNDTAGIIYSAQAYDDNTWHFVTYSSSGTAWSIYGDGSNLSLVVGGGANNGDWFADTANRDNAMVGAYETSDGVIGDFTGTIGEVLVHSTQLSLAEHSYLRQVTKWRYQ